MTDLTAEFEAGRIAYLEGIAAEACPHYATSDCADAWHAGRAFEVRRPTDFMLGKVTKGRGYRVNVAASPAMKGRYAKLVYVVAYPAQGSPTATLQPLD
jgi:hypothetical protein